MFTESLTVRILGDSSDLQQALSEVVSQLEEFQTQLSGAGEGTREISDGLRDAATAGDSLRLLSTQLSAVQQQEQQLSSQTISLNVQPALASLAQLSASIQNAAAQLSQLSGIRAASSAGDVGSTARMGGLSDSGRVGGPEGVDPAPAFLTALNRGDAGQSSRTPSAVVGGPVSTTTNHFGGITVNVTEPGGVNEVMRDLRMQGAALRVRRG